MNIKEQYENYLKNDLESKFLSKINEQKKYTSYFHHQVKSIINEH